MSTTDRDGRRSINGSPGIKTTENARPNVWQTLGYPPTVWQLGESTIGEAGG
jgi:hypothetical protein